MALHRAVIYVRVSTEEQKSRGYSLPEQVRACRKKVRELAAVLGARLGEPVEVVEQVFEDTAPGDILERPALTAMREYVRACRPTWVVCLDPDRLARRLTLQCLLADELERRGTDLVFVQHDVDRTSPEGRAFFQMRGIMAELEKAKILERTGRGKRGKLARGGVPHNVQPYGWDYDPASGEYRPNEAERGWVRQIFRWVARDQWTPGEVARQLTVLGVPPPSSRRRSRGAGQRWHASTVRSLVQSRAYVGELILNRSDWRGLQARRQLPPALRRTLPPEDGGGPLRALPRPETEWVRLPIPPLIDQPLYDAAQAVLARRRRSSRTPRLLSGLLTCALCGGRVHYQTKKGIGYLVCQNRYGRGRRCSLPLLRAAPVEEGVWEQVKHRAAGLSDAGESEADLAQLLEAKRAGRAGLLNLLRDGAISEAEVRRHLAELDEQARLLEERLAARSAEPVEPDRRAAVRRLVAEVAVGPDGWTVCLRPD